MLRVVDARAEIRSPARGAEWGKAPLRILAREHAVGEGPWPWLLAHGIRRPSPSGPSGTSIARADRARRSIEITLSDGATRWLSHLAYASGVSRSAILENLILRAVVK
jgi:hypothetical protein